MKNWLCLASLGSQMVSCDQRSRFSGFTRDGRWLGVLASLTTAALFTAGCSVDETPEDAETLTSELSTPPPADDGATVAWLLERCSAIPGPALSCVCAHAARPTLLDFCADTWAEQPMPVPSASVSASPSAVPYATPDDALSAVEAILEADRVAEEARLAAHPSKATKLDLTPRAPCFAALGCAPQRKVVFVSSEKYSGNLGGLAGADAKCNNLAKAAGLTGTFKAWLSSATESAASRLTHATDPYFLPNGTRVANSWADLVDGGLLAGIHMTERQDSVPPEQAVWSNSSPAGGVTSTSPSSSCASFSSSSASMLAGTGNVDFVGAAWSQRTKKACSVPQRLYCVEQ